MSGPFPYLHFNGQAREALDFYASVFGGTVEAHTFEAFGRTDGPSTSIAHGELHDAPVTISAADAGQGEPSFSATGLMFSLLGASDAATLTEWFAKLSEGGTVVDDLQKREWGASDGQVRDRYGLLWLIGFED